MIEVLATDPNIVEAVRRAVGDVVVRDGPQDVDLSAEVVIVDAVETLLHLRARDDALPVMIVTSPGDVDERVRGLTAGADDAVPADVAMSQMGARVSALSRRGRLVPRAERFEVDGADFDLSAGVCVRNGEPIALTAKEIAILRWLHRHRGRAVSRAELLENVWGASPDMLTKTVDVTVHNLRKKIETDPRAPAVVVAVKGVGYRMP